MADGTDGSSGLQTHHTSRVKEHMSNLNTGCDIASGDVTPLTLPSNQACTRSIDNYGLHAHFSRRHKSVRNSWRRRHGAGNGAGDASRWCHGLHL